MGNSIPLVVSDSRNISARIACLLIANWNSLLLDYVSRLKMGSRNMNYFVVKQLPAVLPNMMASIFQTNICRAVLELTYTAHDMKPFAEDVWGRNSTLTRPHGRLYQNLSSGTRSDDSRFVVNWMLCTFICTVLAEMTPTTSWRPFPSSNAKMKRNLANIEPNESSLKSTTKWPRQSEPGNHTKPASIHHQPTPASPIY